MSRPLGSKLLTGRRWAAGSYDQAPASPTRGEFIEGAEEAISFWGTHQPADKRQMATLPEGVKTEDVQVIFTKFALHPSDDKEKKPADQVDLPSPITGSLEPYKVVKAGRWNAVLRNFEVMVARL